MILLFTRFPKTLSVQSSSSLRLLVILKTTSRVFFAKKNFSPNSENMSVLFKSKSSVVIYFVMSAARGVQGSALASPWLIYEIREVGKRKKFARKKSCNIE